MPAFVIDASTLLAALFMEAHTAVAEAFFAGLTVEDRLIAPALLFVECTSNIREKAYRGAITGGQAEAKLDQALRLPVRLSIDLDQHRTALRFAGSRRTARAYDEHYLAVAFREGAELVTIDSGMYQGAVNLRIPARLLR